MHLDLLWRDMMKSQGSIENEAFFRLITGEEHPLGNLAILRESSEASIVEGAVAPLMDVSKPTAVLFVAGVNEAISEVLTSRGFSKIEPMPAMAVDLTSLEPTKPPEGYDFVKVSSAVDGTEWANVVAAGFQLPRGLARLLSPEVHGASTEPDAQVQFFGIQCGGKMVATTMLYLANGLAGIYCVATLPEERGKGLGAHVTAEALRVAKRLGYGVGVLQSSAAGHGVYLALGFRDFESVPMFIRMPASNGHADAQSNAA
jgi:GNAT superfamily N-acetyltransferase